MAARDRTEPVLNPLFFTSIIFNGALGRSSMSVSRSRMYLVRLPPMTAGLISTGGIFCKFEVVIVPGSKMGTNLGSTTMTAPPFT